MKPKPKATEADRYIGQQIKAARAISSMTQEGLAAGLGTSFQQVQKYENGTNRVSASRLFKISDLMGIPINKFKPPKELLAALILLFPLPALACERVELVCEIFILTKIEKELGKVQPVESCRIGYGAQPIPYQEYFKMAYPEGRITLVEMNYSETYYIITGCRS